MIKFPSTISEYTDSKLWRGGVEGSIARRILVGAHKLQDQKELDLRKMYLAHYYAQIGEYRLAMTIAKQFLLENKYVDDAILLIKKICVEDKDAENFSRLIKLIDKLYHGNTPSKFYDEVEDFDDVTLMYYDKDTGKGKVCYSGATAEYYRGGKLIFSVEDRSCEAFFKDSIARHLLSENQPEAALALLSTIKLSKIKNDIKFFCHQTFVIAYCMLEDYDKAYEYCELLMDNDFYLSEMADILFYLYKTESPNFARMKDFFIGYGKFDSTQLADVHSLAKDIDDVEFWNSVYANNSISVGDLSEESYILKGMLAFNAGDYSTADRLFKQATAIYGHYGKSWLFRYYVDCFLSKYKKSLTARNMPEELYIGRIDDMYTYIDKKLLSKLKKCLSREDFLKRVDDNMLELDNMLSGVYSKICDLTDVVYRVYKMNYVPARDLINKVIVDNDYNTFIRAICLANFMLFSCKKRFVFGKEVYDNPFVGILNFQADGEKEPFAYGIAIYLAGTIFQGIDNAEFKKECNMLKKIYRRAKSDYSDIAPLAVFGVLYAFVNEEKVHYVKGAVKKREVQDFARTIIDDMAWEVGESLFTPEDKVDEFMVFCSTLIKK